MSIYACTYVHVVLHADQPPLVLVVLVLVARPNLLEVGHDVVAAGNKENFDEKRKHLFVVL